jgi:hypothetical protein
MKLIERIAYISFLLNIFVVIFVYIGLPILFINVPNSLEVWTSNEGRNPLNMSFLILSSAVVFHWGYCIWFLYRYDRYSKSIFPLFFLNILYAPIYYYRVKIKKRPLKNKINKPNEEIETEDKNMSDDEFVDLTRKNIFGVIDLWASKENQLEYQKNVPIAQVSTELFCQWEDFYLLDSDDFKQAFNVEELKILSEFDNALKEIVDKTQQTLPVIDEFIETDEWRMMNSKAIEILKKINRVSIR